MKLSKRKLHSLQNLAAGPCWSMTMAEAFFADAQALEKLGLVTFTQRVLRSGRLDGHDVAASPKGLRVLREHGIS